MDSYSSRRVLGHLAISAIGESRGAAAERWRKENLERYGAEHQRANEWARGGRYSIEYSISRDEYELIWRGSTVAQEQLKAKYDQAQLQAQYLQMQAQQLAQMATYAPLYGNKAAAPSSAPLAAPSKRPSKKVHPLTVRLKVWAYSKLSGASPSQVYRQLLKTGEK
jgi:hypothetical protein